MSEGPKRFSLSDYQSKRGHAKHAEASSQQEQKTELEELHQLLGTGFTADGYNQENDSSAKDVLRTPGASPDNRDYSNNSNDASEEHEDADTKSENGSRRTEKRDSKDGKGKKSSSSRRHNRHSHRRSRSPQSHSRSPSPSRSRTRRSRARSASHSRSRSSNRDNSRSRSQSGRSHRSSRRRRRSSHRRSRSRSLSLSKDKVSMRCVFPYEDGGIIIGLRGTHLSKLRRAVPAVDWRISNETNDRQDRVLVVKGAVDDVAEAFKELAEHFISQGMHVDYPPQTRGRGSKDVDTDKPLIPIRLLIPHKTCGAIIGQKSETLISTRISCAARRVYVYRERISDSRERVVEIVGTPLSISKVMKILGNQVVRTLSSDQHESDPYVPERDGLRKFLGKQGVPRSRVSLEAIKPASEKDAANTSSTAKKSASRRGKRSRSRSISSSRSHSSERSVSRSRSRDQKRRHRSSRNRRKRSRSRSPSLSTSQSHSRSPSRTHNKQRQSRRKSSDKAHSTKSGSSRHKDRRPSYSRSRSRSREPKKSRSGSKGEDRSKSKDYSRSSRRRKESGSTHGSSRRRNRSSRRDRPRDRDVNMHESDTDDNVHNVESTDRHLDSGAISEADDQQESIMSQDWKDDEEERAITSHLDGGVDATASTDQSPSLQGGGSW
ncbi:RNA binding protein, heterogenous nuclear RNP-K like protein [Coemansia spiralis]|uniref:RNA binding protein, heterogenous nuclear RNP-K like protein n=2 Tax=Coemansia TaxID=4863 RepID=A0A9W8KYW0_9FUNG|nr:RNA binding protein, heterogenous nuclear RNP-K like protein [Coemansia umbellata]KAJ2623340.1 RNA binding protein, heterogenous nuclear RNP-K like protein [Coemansia sp. RSA 1358]KAJ2678112.1 RNA binding protein, heterogenous nuclear RNP-K like protein [Coemansia spiralis]